MTWTNLHEACENGQPEDVVKEAQAHPESVVAVEDHGWTPLHCAVWRNPSLTAIQSLLEACPQAASAKDIHGNTPLHLAVTSQGIDKEVIRVLIGAHEDAVSETNLEGLMPLHMALRFAPMNEDIIRLLVEQYPWALTKCIKMGDPAPGNDPGGGEHFKHAVFDPSGGMHKDATDLHYGLLSQQTRDGAYPLHMAIQSGVSLQILEVLIKEAPEVLVLTNKFGETPLHLALKKGEQNEQEVDHLLRTNPTAALMQDDKGNYPIHVATCFGCSLTVAKGLIEIKPEMRHAVNREGLTPMACAVQHGRCCKEVLDLISIKDFLTINPTCFI